SSNIKVTLPVWLSVRPYYPARFLYSTGVSPHSPLRPQALVCFQAKSCSPNYFMANITVLLVDDHNIVRQGLRALLLAEGDITIVAEAQTGREAVQLASKHHPEIVVMDLAMPLLNGCEAT